MWKNLNDQNTWRCVVLMRTSRLEAHWVLLIHGLQDVGALSWIQPRPRTKLGQGLFLRNWIGKQTWNMNLAWEFQPGWSCPRAYRKTLPTPTAFLATFGVPFSAQERPLRSLERFDPHLGCWEAFSAGHGDEWCTSEQRCLRCISYLRSFSGCSYFSNVRLLI